MNKKALILIGVSLALIPGLVSAPPKYDRGATDAEIKISDLIVGRSRSTEQLARCRPRTSKMANDQGGIKGRKNDFIIYDDA